jgi:hypothetical protein
MAWLRRKEPPESRLQPGLAPHKGGITTCPTARYSIFTALAASIAIVISEMLACSIIRTLAHRDNTGTSVGEKAVLVLKARNR